MNKKSGFEKFHKGGPKTGSALKEQLRQEKKKQTRERKAFFEQQRAEKAASRGLRSGEPAPRAPRPAKAGDAATSRTQKPRREDSAGGTAKPARVEKSGRPAKAAREEAPRRAAGPTRADKSQDSRDTRETRGPKGSARPARESDTRFARDEEARPPRTTSRPPAKGAAPAKREGSMANFRDRKQSSDKKSSGKEVGKNLPFRERKTVQEAPARPAEAPAERRSEPERKKIIRKEGPAQMPLNKYLAHGGLCSRREAADIVRGGKVEVNGVAVIDPGYKVQEHDEVRFGGKKVTPTGNLVYILLNKPKDYITTTEDPQERKTVLDLISRATDERVYPVGRLDRNTSGVLLLTNDGDLAQRLTHPSNDIRKVYAVTLDKPLTKAHFEDILKGVPLEDGLATVDSLAYADSSNKKEIGIEIHSGRNRIVRRIFEHFGYDVKGLDRVIFAGLTKKNVPRGKWRFLNEKEVRDLKFFKKGKK